MASPAINPEQIQTLLEKIARHADNNPHFMQTGERWHIASIPVHSLVSDFAGLGLMHTEGETQWYVLEAPALAQGASLNQMVAFCTTHVEERNRTYAVQQLQAGYEAKALEAYTTALDKATKRAENLKQARASIQQALR